MQRQPPTVLEPIYIASSGKLRGCYPRVLELLHFDLTFSRRICSEAAKHAIREDVNISHIYQRHIDIAVSNVQRKAQKYALDGSNEVFNKFSNRDTK